MQPKIFIETERLLLREMMPEDAAGMFELDSDPEVLKYIGTPPLTDIQQSRDVIGYVRQQYIDNGIGRWSMIERSTGDFMGWAGLKLITTEMNGHINFHDVGYRLIKRFWGKGYASEASIASAKYAFEQLHLTDLYGLADINNLASRRILQKSGLKEINTFDLDGMDIVWLHAKRPD